MAVPTLQSVSLGVQQLSSLPVDPSSPFGVSYGSLKPAMLYTRGTRSARPNGNLQHRVLSV